MGWSRLLFLSGALLGCSEPPFIALPPAPEGARAVLVAYRSETAEPRTDHRLFALGAEFPVRGELDEVAVLYFDEPVEVLEAGEDCLLLYPRAAFELESSDTPIWREMSSGVDETWLIELLLEDPSACQPCYAFERERWLPRVNPPATTPRAGLAVPLPSGATLAGAYDLALVTDEVRTLSGCPPLARFRAGVARGPTEIYVAGATLISDPPTRVSIE